jgi:hypothetical protein
MMGVARAAMLFGLHVAVEELPLVVLLQEDSADEADDGVLIGEDADDVGLALHFLVQAFERLVVGSLTRCCSGRSYSDLLAADPAVITRYHRSDAQLPTLRPLRTRVFRLTRVRRVGGRGVVC